jgi:dimethylargininase
MRIAITREVSPSIANCELTHLSRQPIDVAEAQRQHQAYEQCLSDLGCKVISLPADPRLPDSVFVEDIAIVLDELAIITRPGAESRRGEIPCIAEALRPYRPLCFIEPPGTVDGGDVLRVGKHLFVGLSTRTNEAAISKLQLLLNPHGYIVHAIEVHGCLHLKSAVTQVAENTLLMNPEWADPALFSPFELIAVCRSEPHAANAVLVGDSIVYPAAFPETQRLLEQRGIPVSTVDVAELAKAEGAVTCCSLVFDVA